MMTTLKRNRAIQATTGVCEASCQTEFPFSILINQLDWMVGQVEWQMDVEDGPIWSEGMGSITPQDLARLQLLVPRVEALASEPVTPSQRVKGMCRC
jgi:hypothetical protein